MPITGLTRSLLRLILAAEEGFAVFIVMYFTGAFVPLYIMNGYGLLKRLDFYIPNLCVSICLFLLILRWERSIQILSQAKLVLLFVGFVLLSTLWSDAPNLTRDAGLKLLETTLVGIYLATRYSFKEQTRIFTLVCGISTLLSLVYVFALPKFGITQTGVGNANTGTWRGIFSHKNNLGRMMTISGIFFLSTAFSNPKRRWLLLACFGIAVLLIFGADSKTALVSLFFLIAISPTYRILRWNSIIAIPLYLIVILVAGSGAMFLSMNWEGALASLNKPPDLNGRVPIWNFVIERIQERPWLGYGFVAFWRGWESEGNAMLWRSMGWRPNSGHNGFLDLVLELGILGAVLFVLGFINTFMRAVARVRLTPTVEGFWPLGYMIYFVLLNQTMSLLLSPFSILWLLYVTINFTPIEQPDRTSNTSPSYLTTSRLTKKTSQRLVRRT